MEESGQVTKAEWTTLESVAFALLAVTTLVFAYFICQRAIWIAETGATWASLFERLDLRFGNWMTLFVRLANLVYFNRVATLIFLAAWITIPCILFISAPSYRRVVVWNWLALSIGGLAMIFSLGELAEGENRATLLRVAQCPQFVKGNDLLASIEQMADAKLTDDERQQGYAVAVASIGRNFAERLPIEPEICEPLLKIAEDEKSDWVIRSHAQFLLSMIPTLSAGQKSRLEFARIQVKAQEESELKSAAEVPK